jgi:hypothetical protein
MRAVLCFFLLALLLEGPSASVAVNDTAPSSSSPQIQDYAAISIEPENAFPDERTDLAGPSEIVPDDEDASWVLDHHDGQASVDDVDLEQARLTLNANPDVRPNGRFDSLEGVLHEFAHDGLISLAILFERTVSLPLRIPLKHDLSLVLVVRE